MNKFATAALSLVIGIAVGGGSFYWYIQSVDTASVTEAPQDQQDKPKPLFYRHPMNPEITSPVPAKDSMGMDYTPVYAEDNDSAPETPAGTVRIDPVTTQNIGVRSAEAELESISHSIRTVGKVSYNEERISRLHPKTEGWIEKLFVDKTGSQVSHNTMLLSIYSPQLVTSAQEYLLAKQSARSLEDSPFEDIRNTALQMVKTARERLRLLDVPEHQIREIENSGEIPQNLHIHSPYSGTVIEIGAREGQFVTPQTELYLLADLSKVWVIAQVYESDLPWIAEGDPVDMQLTALPGQTFHGHVAYIYPYAEADTRTIKVRLVFDNPERKLKPDMFANVTIHAQQQDDSVTVPSEAIVRSGAHERVFVVTAPGQFEPRRVTTGLSAEGKTQILSGVEAGEEVVTSSQFLIDSESKLRESAAKMQPLKDKQAEPDSNDSSMPDMKMESDKTPEEASMLNGNPGSEAHQHD